MTSIINPLNRDDIYDDSWAVIIGIDKYKYSDQLNYAVKDAEAVKDMLISKFDYPEENIRYLTDEEATLSEIKVALGEVATSSGENDRILIFYSGHGETFSNKDGTETGYIIPIEGRQDQPYETGLAMDEILRTCKMSDAKHMLFLMDACYSGLMIEKAKGLAKPQEAGYLSKVANEKARQIITAGGSDEKVIERDEWQHSAFTKNLLAGLDNWESDTDEDGYVTADELGTYLRKSVTEDSDFMQTPQKGRFINSGGGEFVFFGSKNINVQNDIVIAKEQSLFSSFDMSLGIFGNNKVNYGEKSYCNLLNLSYDNIFDQVDIAIGFGQCVDRGKDDNFNINELSIELKYNLLRDPVSFTASVIRELAKYESNNNIPTVGLLPMVGFEGSLTPFRLEAKVGYLIFDIDNIDSQYNGWTIRAGFELSFQEFLLY